jgi:hypothetical protein
MTIETLIRAVPPPEAPFEAFDGPWEPIEAKLGVVLPPDYKDFVRLYGNGYFMGFLGICVPRSRNPNIRLDTYLSSLRTALPDTDEAGYPLWPEPDGLIGFGSTDNGDYLFWLPRGPPEDWKVVIWDRGDLVFEVLDCDLTGFLAGIATGKLAPKAFPDDIFPFDPAFTPNGDARRSSASPAGPIRLSWRLGAYGPSGASSCGVRDDY